MSIDHRQLRHLCSKVEQYNTMAKLAEALITAENTPTITIKMAWAGSVLGHDDLVTIMQKQINACLPDFAYLAVQEKLTEIARLAEELGMSHNDFDLVIVKPPNANT